MNQNLVLNNADNPRVSIIVLNYNKSELSRFFFDNNQKYVPDAHWCLVDNGSDPETVENLKRYARSKHWNIWKQERNGGWIQIQSDVGDNSSDLVLLEKNYGYGTGNNFGIHFLESLYTPELILIVNNDVEWYTDIVTPLADTLEQIEDLAVIAPRIVDKAGTEQNPQFMIEYTKMLQTYFRLGFPVSTVLYNFYSKFFNFNTSNKELFKKGEDIVFIDTQKHCFMGSCFLIKYDVFKELGFFDPNTFLGAEEPIIVHKLREKHYRVAIIPRLQVIHNQGETTKSVFSTIKSMDFFEDSDEYYLREYCHYSGNKLKLIRLGRRYYQTIWLPILMKLRKLREKSPGRG